jgi:phospholipid/cholesterol/gamma-HCH transport system ATP-binding protein
MNAIALEGVRVQFAGAAQPLLDGIDVAIAPGEIVGLIGPAASGKSVLLKLLCGLLAPQTGRALVNGLQTHDIDEDALMKVRAQIGMLFQNNALFDFMTVEQNVAFPLTRIGKLPADEITEQARARLKQVGLAGSEHKFPNQLSGGMRKRAALARAVIARPPIVLYDEPTAGLDPVTTSKVYDLLRAEQEIAGATVLVVSSDVDALRRFAPRMLMIHRGKLAYDGPTDRIESHSAPVVKQFVRGDLEGPL